MEVVIIPEALTVDWSIHRIFRSYYVKRSMNGAVLTVP